ncbi:unnamed protein product [Tilletia controversa]|uniref:Peptidase A1 domain-containing protein n=1 Tax=Tilletia controversa TaxID=13291 RepID=A0A8X7N053_9BASI|nr:hypothetical protein CF328_g844 [Tilletia controversa]KAE8254984.1 hypothetical protein A4X06_0g656 [Tilletia controversa]CAD6939259.1 unnamed protein product [Tilletia controversa]CAD6981608.1 unnamed protein product [Tilletia controversa]CAD6982641.1 unnamed protein product [Tilletia controversa]
MKFSSAALLLLSLLATGATANSFERKHIAARQGPNTVSSQHPADQTSAFNLTAWLVPITRAQAASMACGKALLRPTGLPSGFPIKKNEHLMLIVGGYMYDIRQFNLLSIPQLSIVQAYIPWVDGNNDGTTPYNYNVKGYLGQLVPSLVGNLLQGANSQPGIFDPAHAAYKAVGSSTLTFNVDLGLPNLIDGPGLTTPVYISTFHRSKSTVLTVPFMRSVIEQPMIRSNEKNVCTKSMAFFNETFADTFHVRGDLQTFSTLTSSTLSFKNAQGISGTAQWITPANGQPCSSFA